MKGMYRVALMLGLAVFSATSVSATIVTGPDDATTHEILVVNNYQLPVRVYALDSERKLHNLGRVARGQFKVLELSNEVAEWASFDSRSIPTRLLGCSLVTRTTSAPRICGSSRVQR